MHLSGNVDNTAAIYLNGTLLATASSGFCGTNAIDVDIPIAGLPADNVLAVRASDDGQSTYVDMKLTGTGSAPNQAPVFLKAPEIVYPSTHVGAEVVFQVEAVDPEGKPVQLTWSTLPTKPLVVCDLDSSPTSAGTALATCYVTTTKKMGPAQTVLFFAEDPEGQLSSVAVVIGGSTNLRITTPSRASVVPVILSKGSPDHLRLDLTKDGKAPFCGDKLNNCGLVGFKYFATHYFRSATDLQINLKNKTSGKSCDSTRTKASRVTPIRPAGSALTIGYRIAFDANCGTTSSPSYDGLVVALLIMGPNNAVYRATNETGLSGTSLTAGSLEYLATLNNNLSLAADQLELLKQILNAKDVIDLYRLMSKPEFRQKMIEVLTGNLVEALASPLPGTTSSEAARMFYAAAAAVRAEAAFAFHSGDALVLKESLALNGRNSQWRLWVADVGGLNAASAWLPLVNVRASAEVIMNTRIDIVGGLQREPA